MSKNRCCRAYARSTGLPCKCKALKNGRCRLHGGLSTGPKTINGRAKVSEATKERMANGQLQLAKEGFQRWLINGGREYLVACSERRQRYKQMVTEGYGWLLRK